MIKTIGRGQTGIEDDIPCINVTPNQYNALAPATAYVKNDATIPFNPMTSQSHHK